MNAVIEQVQSVDVHSALEQWGRWVRDGLAGIGWPPETLLARVIAYGALGAAQRHCGSLLLLGTMVEFDEMVAWTEAAVMRLAIEERNVVAQVYLSWEPPEVSAKRLGLSQGTFDSRLSRARRSVRDYLEGRKAAAVALQENHA